MSECQLIQGGFALFIQFILGSLCIGTLVIKRLTEIPRRPWDIWSFDALKQGIGATFGHFANIILSVLLVTDVPVDECQWYCLSYLVDATLGITMNLLLLTAFEWMLRHQPNCSHLKFGDYGDPPSIRLFIAQLSIWLTIVLFTKVVTYSIQLHYSIQLEALMAYLLSGVSEDPKLELVMVMIVIPMTVNSLQFWLTDMFLKNDDATNISTDGRRSLSRQSSGSRRPGHVSLQVEMSPVGESLLRPSRSPGADLEANDTSPLRHGSSSSSSGVYDDSQIYLPLNSPAYPTVTLGSRSDGGSRGAARSTWFQQPFQFLSLLDNMFTGSSASAPSSSTRRRGPASYRHRDPLSRSDLKYDSVSRGATDRDLPSTADALLADSVDSADGDIPLSTAGTRSGLYASHTVGSDDDTGLSSSKRRVMYATTGSSGSTHALRSRHSSRDALTSAPESTISPLHTGSSISLTSASLSVSSSTVLGTNGSAQGVVNTVGSTTSGTIGGRMGDSKLP